MEVRAELYDIRLHRLEKLTSTMAESQASIVRIMQAQSDQLETIQTRLDRLEERMSSAADDVAFIRNFIETKGMD